MTALLIVGGVLLTWTAVAIPIALLLGPVLRRLDQHNQAQQQRLQLVP